MGKKITIIIFLIFIYGFFAWSVTKGDESYSELENRTLAEAPEFSAESFFGGEFTEDYELYIQDQFPMRSGLVSLKNNVELLCGKTLLKGVFLGKDGYLIENHEQADYQSERALKNADAIVSAGNRWEEKLGAEHTSVMLAPTSQTVMREKLPAFAEAYDQTEYIYQIRDRLADGVFVDVAGILSEHESEYIYYRTDHHWTTYGAYLAYRQWCAAKGMDGYLSDELDIRAVSEDFLGTTHSKLNIKAQPDTIEIYSVKDYNIKAVYNMGMQIKDSLYDMSYLEGKDKYGMFLGGNQGIIEITGENNATYSDKQQAEKINEDKSESVLLIIKDSYANCFVPMLAGMYDRMYVVDLRYFNMNIDSFMELYGVTDVLLLYNAGTLTDDVYIGRIG